MAIKILKWGSIGLLLLAVLLPLLAIAIFRIVNNLSRPANLKQAKLNGEELAGTSGKTVLVVVAHPDDADWYAGGTLAALARGGNQFVVAVGTSGEKGGNGFPELAKVREGEQRRSGKVLGYSEIIFLHHPDRGLKADKRFKAQIAELYEKFRPQILFTFDTEKEGYIYRHPDHEAAGVAAMEEAKNSESVKDVYLFHSSAPNVIFDIYNYRDLKADALNSHKSQFIARDNGVLRLLSRLVLGNRRGHSAGFNQAFPEVGVKAAEIFRVSKN